MDSHWGRAAFFVALGLLLLAAVFLPPPGSDAAAAFHALRFTPTFTVSHTRPSLKEAVELYRSRLPPAATSPVGLVACTMTKNNHAALREWLLFHALQGFTHFHVYDDGSEPPLASSGALRGLEHAVTLHSGWQTAAPDYPSHKHIYRQMLAYRHCASLYWRTDTLVALLDVDEYVWPCAGNGSLQAELRAPGVPMATMHCPRFGPLPGVYDPANGPIVAQYTARVPIAAFGEPERETIASLPGCAVKVKAEARVCFPSLPKNAYDLQTLSQQAVRWLSLHGVETYHENFTVNRQVVTTRLDAGVCCAHYFAKDMAEVALKAAKNRNDFYTVLAEHPDVVNQYYRAVNDSRSADRFGALMTELLRY